MSISFAQYFLYLQYLVAGIVMAIVFSLVYLRITPVDELKLIKSGNVACALSFGGALLGFCLTIASSISHTVSFIDFVLWGILAAILQIVMYFVSTFIISDAKLELEGNNVAVGAFFAAVSVSIGVLNAACLS